MLAAILRSQKDEETIERPEFEGEPESAAADQTLGSAGVGTGGTGASAASDLATMQPPPPVDLPPPGRDTVPR